MISFAKYMRGAVFKEFSGSNETFLCPDVGLVCIDQTSGGSNTNVIKFPNANGLAVPNGHFVMIAIVGFVGGGGQVVISGYNGTPIQNLSAISVSQFRLITVVNDGIWDNVGYWPLTIEP